MYESVFWDTPNHKKKRRPVACQEVGRGAKIIAFFRCYTWRLRQNRVAATERDAKRGNNWATQRAVNCGVHSLGPAREHVETYSHAWKTLNIPNKDFNTRPNPVSFNSGPNAVTFCCKYDVSKTHTHIYLWKFAIIWFIVIPQSCCEKRLFATSCPPTCPSVRKFARNKTTPMRGIFVKYHSWNSYSILSTYSEFRSKRIQITDTLQEDFLFVLQISGGFFLRFMGKGRILSWWYKSSRDSKFVNLSDHDFELS